MAGWAPGGRVGWAPRGPGAEVRGAWASWGDIGPLEAGTARSPGRRARSPGGRAACPAGFGSKTCGGGIAVLASAVSYLSGSNIVVAGSILLRLIKRWFLKYS